MPKLNIHRVNAVPQALEANSMYVVEDGGSLDHCEVFFTGNSGAVVRHIPKRSEIDGWIDAKVQGLNNTRIVENISERDNLVLTQNTTVTVLNATDDPTVSSGGAIYAYSVDDDDFYKQSETESLDIIQSWAGLVGKPSSSPAAIDQAVSRSHQHSNQAQLDKIGESNGAMTYDGQTIGASWASTDW